MRRFYEFVGWYGAFALLSAYALASFSVLRADGVWYQLLSVTGCAGIAAVSLYKRTYQPVVLNVISVLIGLAALMKIFLG